MQYAFGLIKDIEASRAVEYRFIQGYSYKETLLFFRRILSDSTNRDEGVESMANSLKLMGFFEEDITKF